MLIEEDVKTVELKAVLIINDRLGNRLETFDYQLLDLLVAVVYFLLAVAAHQVELHSPKIPLATKLVIIVI